MDTRNHEHYRDKTAHDAIKAADKSPNAVRETVENMRREANKRGFETRKGNKSSFAFILASRVRPALSAARACAPGADGYIAG